ncbi:hypothetical protein GCM10010129_32790 [Streptomyces fumigatiscleroticus]|nr:hypothetical protein GCM10010129_32790 [Streptomyces fumigatiscleroticus]
MCDESSAPHRASCTGLSRTVPLPQPALHDALDDRHMTPAARTPRPDVAEVLRTLRERGAAGDGRRAYGGAAAVGCAAHFVGHPPVARRLDGLRPVPDPVA